MQLIEFALSRSQLEEAAVHGLPQVNRGDSRLVNIDARLGPELVRVFGVDVHGLARSQSDGLVKSSEPLFGSSGGARPLGFH